MSTTDALHDRALLLHKISFSDSSIIATWLTREHGRIKTILKGARRPKSPFHGRVDFFLSVDLGWKRARHSEIHTGIETGVHHAWTRIAREYPRMTCGLYFAELIDLLTALEDPAPELHELLQRAWGYLETHPPSVKLVHRFERALADQLGFISESTPPQRIRPILDEQIGRAPHSRVMLDLG